MGEDRASLSYRLRSTAERRQGKNLETEIEAEEHCLLVYSPDFLSYPSHTAQPTCLEMALTAVGWAQLPSRKCPIDMSTGQSDGGDSSVEVASTQVCKVDK